MFSAAFAPLLAPHDPTDLNVKPRKSAPATTTNFLLGTDTLSRLIYGARTSVFISLVALGTGALIGTGIGMVAGYFGGQADIAVMRIVDAVLGFPTILLALIIVSILGNGIMNIIIAVAATLWARFAR